MSDTTHAPPVYKTPIYGRVTVSVWENRSKDGHVFYSFTPTRFWRDEQGQPHDSTSFQDQDAMGLKTGIDDVYRWLQTEGRERARQQRQPDDTDAVSLT